MLCIALYGKPIPELWNITCHIRSHNVNCHPTRVNMAHLNPMHTGRYWRHGRLSYVVKFL